MAQPYQLIYRLEDFRSDTPYITSTVNGSTLNIYKDIVGQVNRGKFSKLGIQAPAGVIFYINSDQESIRMGRTGIYELDEDISVSSLYFQEMPNYVKDDAATAAKLSEGISQLQSAKTFYEEQVNNIGTTEDTQYWSDYAKIYNGGTLSNGTTISQGYSAQMEGAYSAIIQGLNGVYKKDGTKEINNVIIDFLIEEGDES